MDQQQVKSVGQFQLGDCIGKGAFGAVYRGLNMETGEVVAIKQVKMQNIPKSEIQMIMMEIDLLKKLNHSHIVKYLGFVKTRDYLYIILEYCENGSLLSTMKKFGKMSENLVALYIYQVLKGLLYLHDEGVIHRDIKGANILTTKEGHVKLGDFGVATKLNEAIGEDSMVAGSPYWMAPEVVEMQAPSTSSDIWSVGCTIIELLQGEPPYFSFPPMAALFKIVQDDHPPFPEGASPLLQDFLMHCFQKDPNLRITAKKLMKHGWLLAARSKIESGSEGGDLSAFDDESDTRSKSDRSESEIFDKSATVTIKNVDINVQSFMESGNDDFGDDFDIDIESIESKLQNSGLVTISHETDEKLQDLPDLEDQDDPFSALENFNQDPAKEAKARVSIEIMDLIRHIKPDEPLESLSNTFTRLTDIFRDNPDLSSDLIKYHGVIPVLSILEKDTTGREHVIYKLLEMINSGSSGCPEFLENICFLGGTARILQLIDEKYPRDIRYEAGVFIKNLIKTNDMTRRVFVSCRGLGVLVSCIQLNYRQDYEIIWTALDGIHSILNLQGSSKNDFCRLFIESDGLLDYMDVFHLVVYDRKPESDEFLVMMLDTLNIMSRSDAHVKEAMASKPIVKAMINEYDHLTPANQLSLLKCLKNLSVSPTFLDSLQKLRAGDSIVKLMSFNEGQYFKEIRNQALYILFNFCRLNKSRQEIAANAGIVPHLLHLIKSNSPLKQFALPILCDLAHNKNCKEILWTNSLLPFYIQLMSDLSNSYWELSAIDAINAWLIEDQRKVEQNLLEPANLSKLVQVFVNARHVNFESVVVAFQKLALSSTMVSRSLATNEFMDKLLSKLSVESVGIRLNLLKILLAILRAHSKPKLLAMTYDVETSVQPLASQGTSVLVREMASTIMQEISQAA